MNNTKLLVALGACVLMAGVTMAKPARGGTGGRRDNAPRQMQAGRVTPNAARMAALPKGIPNNVHKEPPPRVELRRNARPVATPVERHLPPPNGNMHAGTRPGYDVRLGPRHEGRHATVNHSVRVVPHRHHPHGARFWECPVVLPPPRAGALYGWVWVDMDWCMLVNGVYYYGNGYYFDGYNYFYNGTYYTVPPPPPPLEYY